MNIVEITSYVMGMGGGVLGSLLYRFLRDGTTVVSPYPQVPAKHWPHGGGQGPTPEANRVAAGQSQVFTGWAMNLKGQRRAVVGDGRLSLKRFPLAATAGQGAVGALARQGFEGRGG